MSTSISVLPQSSLFEIIDALDGDHSKSIRRGIAYAIKLSLLSNCPNYKVGAALIKNGNVIAQGWNWFKKTAPDSTTRHQGIHAEFHCLRAYSKRLEHISRFVVEQTAGATLFVARTTITGELGIAKPCEHCQEFLKYLKLKKIYFTDRDGSISDMVLKN